MGAVAAERPCAGSIELADATGDDGRLAVVLAAAGIAKSRSEARRLIQGGGVTVDNEKISDVDHHVGVALQAGPVVVRVGKKRAVRVVKRHE